MYSCLTCVEFSVIINVYFTLSSCGYNVSIKIVSMFNIMLLPNKYFPGMAFKKGGDEKLLSSMI